MILLVSTYLHVYCRREQSQTILNFEYSKRLVDLAQQKRISFVLTAIVDILYTIHAIDLLTETITLTYRKKTISNTCSDDIEKRVNRWEKRLGTSSLEGEEDNKDDSDWIQLLLVDFLFDRSENIYWLMQYNKRKILKLNEHEINIDKLLQTKWNSFFLLSTAYSRKSSERLDLSSLITVNVKHLRAQRMI